MPYHLPALLARGHAYKPMPVADIAWLLEAVKHFCDQEGIAFTAYPMFELIPTDGVSLARRDDWQLLLETAQACGIKTLWFAIHGQDEVHDEMVNYPDAYQSIVTMMGRARAMGLRCGSNVLISRACLPQFDTWMDWRLRLPPIIPTRADGITIPEIPLPIEAARQGGNPNGQKVHLWASDIYTKWLDTALAPYRRY